MSDHPRDADEGTLSDEESEALYRGLLRHHLRELELHQMLMLSILHLPPGFDPQLAKLIQKRVGYPSAEPRVIWVETQTPIDGTIPTTRVRVELPAMFESAQFCNAPTEALADLDGYRLELLGLHVPPGERTPEEAARLWTISLHMKTGDLLTVDFVAYQRRIFLGNSDVYAELLWEPGTNKQEDHIRVGGLEHPHGVGDLRKIEEGVGILKDIPRVWEGPTPGSRAEYVSDFARAMIAVTQQEGIPFRRVTWRQIAEEMGLSQDGVTYRRNRAVESNPEITKDEIVRFAEFSTGSSGDIPP